MQFNSVVPLNGCILHALGFSSFCGKNFVLSDFTQLYACAEVLSQGNLLYLCFESEP